MSCAAPPPAPGTKYCWMPGGTIGGADDPPMAPGVEVRVSASWALDCDCRPPTSDFAIADAAGVSVLI